MHKEIKIDIPIPVELLISWHDKLDSYQVSEVMDAMLPFIELAKQKLEGFDDEVTPENFVDGEYLYIKDTSEVATVYWGLRVQAFLPATKKTPPAAHIYGTRQEDAHLIPLPGGDEKLKSVRMKNLQRSPVII